MQCVSVRICVSDFVEWIHDWIQRGREARTDDASTTGSWYTIGKPGALEQIMKIPVTQIVEEITEMNIPVSQIVEEIAEVNIPVPQNVEEIAEVSKFQFHRLWKRSQR